MTNLHFISRVQIHCVSSVLEDDQQINGNHRKPATASHEKEHQKEMNMRTRFERCIYTNSPESRHSTKYAYFNYIFSLFFIFLHNNSQSLNQAS